MCQLSIIQCHVLSPHIFVPPPGISSRSKRTQTWTIWNVILVTVYLSQNAAETLEGFYHRPTSANIKESKRQWSIVGSNNIKNTELSLYQSWQSNFHLKWWRKQLFNLTQNSTCINHSCPPKKKLNASKKILISIR